MGYQEFLGLKEIRGRAVYREQPQLSLVRVGLVGLVAWLVQKGHVESLELQEQMERVAYQESQEHVVYLVFLV